MTELYNVGNPINRVERNNLNATFQDIRNEVARTMYRIDYFANEINGVQSQLNNIVVTGDSSVEAAQARVGYDNTVYSTLKERLDTEIIEALNGGGGGGLTKATTQQAVEGTDDEAYMTPLKVNDVTGTIANLETTNKNNLVGAINELFTDVDSGKGLIADAITDKGVPTSSSATFSQMADNIEAIPTNTPVVPVVGTAISSSDQLDFTGYRDGQTYLSRYLTVSGLNFKPSKIILVRTTGSDNTLITEYYESFLGRTNFIRLTNLAVDAAFSINNYSYRLSGNAYVNTTGFRLPVSGQSLNFTWYAYR